MEERAPTGALASIRALGATLLDGAATRVELAIVELREEGERRKGMLLLAIASGVFLGMALLLATFFVIVFFWDTHRLAAIGVMTLVYLSIGLGAIARMRRDAREAPRPFEATLRELAADRDMLKGRHE
ncbi:MAG: phage holin family protein [Bacillota bacterium]